MSTPGFRTLVTDVLTYLWSFTYHRGTITMYADGSRSYSGMPAREVVRVMRSGFGGRHRHRVCVADHPDYRDEYRP